MKTIYKFRGKRIDNGQWIYGDLIQTRHNCYIVTFPFIPSLHINASEFIEIDPKTVGQFTGLFDKQGVEIYEGDIINTPDGIFIVNFILGSFWVNDIKNENEAPLYVYANEIWPTRENEDENISEVIGDIFSNPELL